MTEEECEERLRLIDKYGECAAKLAATLHLLKGMRREETERGWLAANQARIECEEAWQALELHTSQHGCAPVVSSVESPPPTRVPHCR